MTRILWWDIENRREETPGMADGVITLARGPNLDPKRLACADVIVAEAHDLTKEEVRCVLTPVLALRTQIPVVLVTAPDPENLLFLKDMSVDEVAWPAESVEAVTGKAVRLAYRSVRRRAAAELCSSLRSTPLIESVIEQVFLGEKPIRRVQELAQECFVSVSTLDRSWAAARADRHPRSLKSLLDFALLLRAWELHGLGLLSCRKPRLLGINGRTLTRLARRCVGLPLREFLVLDSGALEKLVREVLTKPIDGQTRSA